MDMTLRKKTGKSIKFTLDGKAAILSESNDLFGASTVTLIIDGEYIGAYDVYTIDQVHEMLEKDSSFADEAYC